MKKSSGLIFEGAVEFASEVVSGGDFLSLSLQVELSEGDPTWDLRGVDEVIPETEVHETKARTGDVRVVRLSPEDFDLGELKDGESDSRVLLIEAFAPKFKGNVRESSLFVRGGNRFGTGLVAAIQRFPRVWVSEDFIFCSKFVLDMRG